MHYCNHEGCCKSFTNKHSLKRHMITHDPNKKYQCDVWTKSFSLPQYLKEHKIVHTGHRPFVWNFPNWTKSFRQAGKLSIHRKEHQQKRFQQRLSYPVFEESEALKSIRTDVFAFRPNLNLSGTWITQNYFDNYYWMCDVEGLLKSRQNNYVDYPAILPLNSVKTSQSGVHPLMIHRKEMECMDTQNLAMKRLPLPGSISSVSCLSRDFYNY